MFDGDGTGEPHSQISVGGNSTNYAPAGVEEEEEKWRQIVEEKDGEIQRTRSALSQAQVERQADLVRLNTRLEELQTEKANVIDSECSSPPPELIEYAQPDGIVVDRDAEADLGTSV